MLLGACQTTPVDTRVTVSFDWNVQTTQENPESIKVNPGEAYGQLPNPDFTLEGYDFNGWNTRGDAKGEFITEDSIVSEDAQDHTLYGNWKGRQYTVTYNLNGGNINGATELAPKTVTYGNMYGAMVIPNNPEKKNSTFLGWFLTPEPSGTPVTYSTIVRTAHDHTLYALFKDTRLVYEFNSEEELEDFEDLRYSLELEISDGDLVISNHSDDPRAYLALKTPLKAGSVVDFDVEFVGEADASERVKAAFYLYGGDADGRIISAGQMGNPHSADTRDEIKQWYWGQGANNVERWELPEWNNGHMHQSMNILENCTSVVMMMEFGRQTVLDDEGHETDDYTFDKTLWENNQWVIHSIYLHPADLDLVKPEYNFDEEDDILSFVDAHNLDYYIEDEQLKVAKGTEGGDSYFEFETQYLPKGSKVEYEVQFVGNQKYSEVQEVGINTHGLYPNGMVLNRKVDGTAIDPDVDSEHIVKWFWGGYCINNNSWDPATLVAGEFTKFTTYIYEDCFGIKMSFKFGTSDGYFLINSIRVVQAGDILTRYNFANENQLLDISSYDGTPYALDEDDYGCFLKVTRGPSGEGNISLNTLLTAGQKVYIDIELSTSDESFSGNTYTFIVHQATYAGKRLKVNGEEHTIGVMGTNSWDGHWDGSLCTVEVTVDTDCYGLVFQHVFGQDANAFFLIRNIDIE